MPPPAEDRVNDDVATRASHCSKKIQPKVLKVALSPQIDCLFSIGCIAGYWTLELMFTLACGRVQFP